jgi:8-oxo-dGTP diphosphatase
MVVEGAGRGRPGTRRFLNAGPPVGRVRENERGYEVPTLATDAVLVYEDEVLLVQRGTDPLQGAWALPGGFVEVGETVEAACRRELREETGLEAELVGLVGVYSDPDRDPRGHVVSTPFLASPGATPPPTPEAADDAAGAGWHPLDAPPELAFDHGQILADARRMLDALRADRRDAG